MWKPMFSPNWTRDRIRASSIRLLYFAMRRDHTDIQNREDQYTARGWWADDTLTRWLERHVRERPDAPALAFQNTSLSWEELEKNVLLTAAGLRARGVRRGDAGAIDRKSTRVNSRYISF